MNKITASGEEKLSRVLKTSALVAINSMRLICMPQSTRSFRPHYISHHSAARSIFRCKAVITYYKELRMEEGKRGRANEATHILEYMYVINESSSGSKST